MNDAISRSAVMRIVEQSSKDAGLHYADAQKILRWLKNAPALDVSPVKHGHWIRCKGRSTLWYCSECGDKMLYNPTRRTYNIVKLPMSEKNKFCRNCGAHMDGDPHESGQ